MPVMALPRLRRPGRGGAIGHRSTVAILVGKVLVYYWIPLISGQPAWTPGRAAAGGSGLAGLPVGNLNLPNLKLTVTASGKPVFHDCHSGSESESESHEPHYDRRVGPTGLYRAE